MLSEQAIREANDRGEQNSSSVQMTLADVNRVLDVGQLLASVLTPEELSDLRTLLDNEVPAS